MNGIILGGIGIMIGKFSQHISLWIRCGNLRGINFTFLNHISVSTTNHIKDKVIKIYGGLDWGRCAAMRMGV